MGTIEKLVETSVWFDVQFTCVCVFMLTRKTRANLQSHFLLWPESNSGPCLRGPRRLMGRVSVNVFVCFF